MYTYIFSLLFLIISSTCLSMPEELQTLSEEFATIDNWANYCFDSLPEHKHMPDFHPTKLSFEDIFSLFTLFQKTTCIQTIHHSEHWHEESISSSVTKLFGASRKNMSKYIRKEINIIDDIREPFIQRLRVHENQQLCFMGDLHGSIHALLRNLLRLVEKNFINNEWKILDPNNYLIFLGDFVDRGSYGLECWITLLLLYINNPHNVIILRGNHEEVSQWKNHYFRQIKKNFNFATACTIADMFTTFCEQLPYALFIISGECEAKPSIVQCSHGGINPQMDPLFFQAFIHNNDLSYAKLQSIDLPFPNKYKKPELEIDNCGHNGFIWSDFIGVSFDDIRPIATTLEPKNWSNFYIRQHRFFPQQTLSWTPLHNHSWLFNHNRGAGYLANIEDTREYFKIYGLSGCFRGHQDTECSLKFLIHNREELIPWYDLNLFYRINHHKLKKEGLRVSTILRNKQTAPVFTLTTATEARGLPEEGFIIAQTANIFSEWTLHPHIYPVDINLYTAIGAQKETNLYKVSRSTENDFIWTPWDAIEEPTRPSFFSRALNCFSLCRPRIY